MIAEETWTIKKLLDWTTEYFKKFDIEWPHLEAEILLAHALKFKRIDLYVHFERALKEEELKYFKRLILRRSKHEPIAYITGIQPFMSLDFKVDPAVLIPRPETEKLVEATIDLAKEFENPKILDIGTGCGNIAISLAKYIPGSAVLGIDSSAGALNIASENAKIHKIEDRCKFAECDLFPESGNKFDLIVSNPPYIPTGEIDKLQEEIKFEPRAALDGGPDGLDHIKKIIDSSSKYLTPKGYLILEFGMGQANKILEYSGSLREANIMKDNSGIDRILILKMP
jgi:release factor glutamine methyltransferase